jgi:hypothetical protein
MLQYIEEIVLPYIENVREQLHSPRAPALAIMDNFKGQITNAVNELLEDNDIHTCHLPPNTTDQLQPMDLSVNKPFKNFIKNKFAEWYSEEVWKQLDDETDDEFEISVNLSLANLKELSASWVVEAAEYICENPSIIVNGFIQSGITGAMDAAHCKGEEESYTDNEIEEDFSDFTSDEHEDEQ